MSILCKLDKTSFEASGFNPEFVTDINFNIPTINIYINYIVNI